VVLILGRMMKTLQVRRCITRHSIALLLAAVFVQQATHSSAAELEPRAYVNTPPGINFLIAGYVYSEGGLSTPSASPIKDANLTIHTGVLAYARTLDVWGASGKFDVIVPYADLSGTARVGGKPRERNITGFVDPRFRFSVNFLGAPVLSMEEFATYQPDLLMGASVQVSAPLGQYDSTKLVNLGANRWYIKPDIGISKTWGALTLELSAGVTFYTINDEYYGGKTLQQDPVYSTQAHITYDFGKGLWCALDGTYDYGGRTTVSNVRGDDLQGNSRVGATLALPVNRNNSVKLYTSTSVHTRAGSDYTLGGIAWQLRWW
jgi:hypothetical protein